jgi:protein-S-isoprenylcysteine O-methyltransferase Ste14
MSVRTDPPPRYSWLAQAGLALRNLLFTVVVPGSGGVYVPWLILRRGGGSQVPVAWPGGVVIAAGVLLYLSSQWIFAVAGRGTPGPWDAPRGLVAVGPYRWVRNPIYLAALLIVVGEAWLFLSADLLLYAGALAVAFHLLVIGHEEPGLQARFGDRYQGYRRAVARWIPRPPGERHLK